MSNLTGHAKITATAVGELAREWQTNPLATGMQSAGLPSAAITRDIIDVLILGHWADFGQKHHFMRQFDSQSPYQAYEAAVNWIHSNALSAAQLIAKRIAKIAPRGFGTGTVANYRGHQVFMDVNWQPLGNAVHALEDSFAKGHVTRGKPLNAKTPGAITHVKRYAGAEKEGHEAADEEWEGKTGDPYYPFSLSGRLAIEAVKALLKIVIATGQSGRQPQELIGWGAFREHWLKADKTKLSAQNDRVFELIDRYYTGARLGATNIKTLNMDEDGLAKALLNESPQTILAVFVRLDDQYNSDADDVAELYVNLVRARGGAAVTKLKSNKELIRRLIKVMDEGWTSSGEEDCIKYLKGLL